MSLVGTKTKSVRDIGDEYCLSKNIVARYLRINKLIPELKAMLDEEQNGKKLPIRIAVSLLYLRENEQHIVHDLLVVSDYFINMKKVETLRHDSKEGELSAEDIKQILLKATKPQKQRAVKIDDDLYSRYFSEDNFEDDISEIISQALEM